MSSNPSTRLLLRNSPSGKSWEKKTPLILIVFSEETVKNKFLTPSDVNKKQKWLNFLNWTQDHKTNMRDICLKVFITKPWVPLLCILRILSTLGCILSSILFTAESSSLQKEKFNQITGLKYNVSCKNVKNQKMCWHDSVGGSYNHYWLQRRKKVLIINTDPGLDQDLQK